MKILNNLPVYILVLIYAVFGLNYFFSFITMPPLTGDAGTFLGLLFSTKYLLVVKILEVLLAILLIVPKTRSLALLLIAPITVNILLFELLIAQKPGIGILLFILNALAIYINKQAYIGILVNDKK